MSLRTPTPAIRKETIGALRCRVRRSLDVSIALIWEYGTKGEEFNVSRFLGGWDCPVFAAGCESASNLLRICKMHSEGPLWACV